MNADVTLLLDLRQLRKWPHGSLDCSHLVVKKDTQKSRPILPGALRLQW